MHGTRGGRTSESEAPPRSGRPAWASPTAPPGAPGHGRVVGRSGRDATAPQSEPVTGRHLLGSVLRTLFDIGQLRLVPKLPREFAKIMAGYEGIPELA
jgi:hypothetical protein